MRRNFDPADRPRLLAELVRRRAAGETFEVICATPGWPTRPTLRKWLRQTPAPDLPRLRARPVRWSRRIANTICNRLAFEGLREICRDPDMPDRKTVHLWRRKRPWFDARLARARAESGQPRTGRRTTWCPLTAREIYLHLSLTGSLTAACDAPDMPAPRTVRDWARIHPDMARLLDLGRRNASERRADRTMPELNRWIETELAKKRAASGR